MELITSRRSFVQAVGLATVAGLGLAGCSSSTTDSGSAAEETATAAVTATATSTIFGSADTANKSTLKKTLIKTSGPGDTNIYYYDENGDRVTYPEDTVLEMPDVTYVGEATISLGDDVDDSLIDSSAAVVALVEGDGYYVDELVLSNTALDGDFEGGSCTYTLAEGDLTWNMGDYPLVDENSGREWSCFGGDGNGCYTFTFQVSGIVYDGEELDPVTFPVEVYIWGRDGSDMVEEFNATEDPVAVESESGVEQTDEVQWTWVGDGDKPILCDNLADDFFVTWPSGTDASGITADDVTVTLASAYGATLELEADSQFVVFASEAETQIAVTYMNWPYTPVYTTMTIAVAADDLEASQTYDIASVYIYMVQQGGGGETIDGTVTAYSYYGFDNLTDASQILNDATYTLGVAQDDETTLYYAEDESGTAYLTDDETLAVAYDANGEDDCNHQLVAQTAFSTTRVDQTVDMEVDGETVTFTKSYSSSTKSAEEAAAAGLEPAAGFALADTITPYEMWAWQDRFLAGYTPDKEAPTSFPYTTFPYGY